MKTQRTAEGAPGRLFPALSWDHGWTMSLQADRAGYACSPREHLDCLEDYETVEVKLDGPFAQPVDPHALGLPPEVAAKFTQSSRGSLVLQVEEEARPVGRGFA